MDLPQPLSVVGAGRLGSAIAQALRAAGVPVTGPYGRGYRGDGDAAVLLCVPDDAITSAARVVPAGPLLGHCSGASGLDVLGDREGFSLHPLMTVTGDGVDFTGVTATVAGSTPRALGVANELARVLRLRAVEVADADRVAYHAAAAFASNFLVTVESAAAELMSTAGLDRAVLLPLARAALENWGSAGPSVLTGPVARGDQRTVARHREAVRDRSPELLGLFDALVGATERLAAQNLAARHPAAQNPAARHPAAQNPAVRYPVGSAEPATTGIDPVDAAPTQESTRP